MSRVRTRECLECVKRKGAAAVMGTAERRHWAQRLYRPRRDATVGAIAIMMVSGCSSSPPPAADQPGQSPPTSTSSAANSRPLTIWLTGYSWQDNTPPGSSEVGEPVLHSVAGGIGTYRDPITVATSGHQGNQEWPPGTKFYLPTVRRYVIVEDSGAAAAPSGTDTHLDVWSDGHDGAKQDVDACMDRFTGKVPAHFNPPDGLPVMTGPIYIAKNCNIPEQPDDLGTYLDPDGGNGSSSEN